MNRLNLGVDDVQPLGAGRGGGGGGELEYMRIDILFSLASFHETFSYLSCCMIERICLSP